MKSQITGRVLAQECIAEGIFSLWLEAGEIARAFRPGQFVNLYCDDASRILPRPISICEAKEGAVRLVYRVNGAGTEEFSRRGAGEALRLTGPLGNGFPLPGGRAVLIGGGIGIPPLLGLAKALPGEKIVVAGYRNEETFLLKELQSVCPVAVATEDGSAGTEGNVLDAVRGQGIRGDVIFACGPGVMLKAVKAFAAEQGIPCYLSLEERMACGIGACLGCVCRTVKTDGHSHVKNARVCVDGPVFRAEDVEL